MTNDKSIKIEFYQKPRLCKNPYHKIDFLVEDDEYNPFAKRHLYSTANLCIDDDMYDKIIDLVMHKDLIYDKRIEMEKGADIAANMLPFLKYEMNRNNIEFKKSSKFFVQSAFAKMSMKTVHSLVTLFFQLLGTTKKKTVQLTSTVFLKCNVQCIQNYKLDKHHSSSLLN